MESPTPIPVEQQAPKHRGSAYTHFEKCLSTVIDLGRNPVKEKCITINIYPIGVPHDEE